LSFLSVATLLHLESYGQNDFYIFRNINSSAGLASDYVTGITQDDKGFMWISSGNGVQKYDGNTFTSYHHDPFDTLSINSDNTGRILKDSENNIWIFTVFLGFNILNSSTGKNVRVSDFKDPEFKDLNNSSSGCLDNQGNVWLISLNAIAKYDRQTHRLVSYNYLIPKGKAIGLSNSIICDPHTGNLWIHSFEYGICMLDPKKKIFYTNEFNPERLPIFNLAKNPGLMYLDRENNLWINTYFGDLYKYNLDTHKSRKYFSGDTKEKHIKNKAVFIDCMMQDENGRIWMGARKDGLLEYLPLSDSFRLIPRNGATPGSLNYNEFLTCLYQDKEGIIWIGSDKGISIFDPLRQQFHSVNLPAAKNRVNTTAVLSLVEVGNNDIWAATYGQGIQVFDSHLKYKTSYSYKAGLLSAIGDPGNRAWSFLKVPDGKIYIGCQHGWLSIFDPKYSFFSTIQPHVLLGNTILKMDLDSSQNVWFALYGGLAKWDRKKNLFKDYTDLLSYHGITEKQVFDLLIDKRQNIWVATQTRGLQKFDPVSGRFTKIYVPIKDDPSSISDHSIQCIIAIKDSLFALGTAAGGIDLFNPYTGSFSYITTRDGLPSNNISALYFQAPHDLWVAASEGLCKVNLENKMVFHYGLEDGIFNNNFSDCLRFHKTKEGNLLLGYDGGFVSFKPDSVRNFEAPANVTLTGFKIFDEPMSVDSLFGKSGTVSLSFKQNFITIAFASLSYLEPKRITYYYQLQTVDKDWVKSGNQRFASYANLAPGKYSFSVKCENRDGIPSRRITSIIIVINPPFWQTWWFRLLLVSAIAALLYLLYKYRINQLLKLQAMRNEISKDLHDDLGATLGSISILSEVALNKSKSGEQDQTHSLLTMIRNHSQEMVEKMSDIVWAINPRNETLEKVIHRLKDYGLEACASKEIRLEFNPDESSLTRPLPMVLIKNIYLVVKEAMNNSMKHADCTNLIIMFKSFTDHLEITISDDGSGFDPRQVKNGNGLGNMESRVNEMNGTLTIQSENNGTVIGLKVPLT
jgi:signal transduction histidine kinase/ligand-binding sensor domain-containing protein